MSVRDLFRTMPGYLPQIVAIIASSLITPAAWGQHDLALWYTKPAREWTQAMPVGNGRLGAMVFGDFKNETIQLNEESIWGGSKINNNNPQAKEHLPAIRQAVYDGQYQKVWDMADQYLLGTPPRIRSYQPLGDLLIRYPGEAQPTGYRRSLTLNTGIARTEYTIQGHRVVQEVFASSPDDVLVVQLEADEPLDLEVAIRRGQDVDQYGSAPADVWFTGQIRDEASGKEGPGGKHMRFSARMKMLACDGKFQSDASRTGAGFRISQARHLTLIVTGATDYNPAIWDTDSSLDPLAICTGILDDASKKSPLQLRREHENDHRSMFERVSFTLGDSKKPALPTDERLARVQAGETDLDLIALYYQYGRYLLMGSSRRPARLPANLQGIWNKEYTAKWNSDFHTNINLQMNYWPAETGNLGECSVVLAEFVKRLMVPGSVTAQEMYGARGWTVHHLTDVFGRTGVADGVWGFSPMAGPWMTFPIYRHYEFTKDESYLRNIAYPVMKGSVLFVLDFLTESPEGYLVTNPSHSPENAFVVPGSGGKEKAYLSYGTTIDNQIIRGLFSNFTEAAGVLGTDADLVDQVRQVEKRLPPMKIGSNGTLQEWIKDFEEFEPGHRHISHLLGLYPLDLITPEDTVLFNAARKTIERRMAHSTRHVGWSSAWIINFYARLLDGEKAGAQVQRLLQYSTLHSLLNTIPPFQIDGNFGGAAGIAEMLLQSHGGVINLLPALPAAWKDGSISGIRARGNYTIDMAWHRGKLSRLVIRAGQAGSCRVRYQGHEVSLKVKQGRNDFTNDHRFIK